MTDIAVYFWVTSVTLLSVSCTHCSISVSPHGDSESKFGVKFAACTASAVTVSPSSRSAAFELQAEGIVTDWKKSADSPFFNGCV